MHGYQSCYTYIVDCRIVLARIVYLAVFGLLLERSSAQPVTSQMFHARGERKRGSLDGGRSGVLQEATAAMFVGPTGPGSRGVRLRGRHLRLFSIFMYICILCVSWFLHLFLISFLHLYIYTIFTFL